MSNSALCWVCKEPVLGAREYYTERGEKYPLHVTCANGLRLSLGIPVPKGPRVVK